MDPCLGSSSAVGRDARAPGGGAARYLARVTLRTTVEKNLALGNVLSDPNRQRLGRSLGPADGQLALPLRNWRGTDRRGSTESRPTDVTLIQ